MLMSKDKIIKFEFLCILFLICFYNLDKIENAVQVLVKLYELIKEFIIALLAWIAFSNLKNIWQRKIPSRSPIYNITFIYIFMQVVLLVSYPIWYGFVDVPVPPTIFNILESR